jgi:uncharacterized protein HemX
MWHSGVMTELKNAQKEATEARSDIKQVLDAIHKKASTATLLVVCGLIISALGVATGFWYDSHQRRMSALESVDRALQVRMDEQIKEFNRKFDEAFKNLNSRLDTIPGVAKKVERGKEKGTR